MFSINICLIGVLGLATSGLRSNELFSCSSHQPADPGPQRVEAGAAEERGQGLGRTRSGRRPEAQPGKKFEYSLKMCLSYFLEHS